MNAMILAAGKGTRLYPLTEKLPKPMVPVAGLPVLEHSILWLRRHGIQRIAINLHYKGAEIRKHFGDGSRLGVSLRYSEEMELLGTAGGVKRVADFFEDPFIVVYGDVLTDFDLGALLAFHRAHGSTPHATLTLDRRPDSAACGVVALDEQSRITSFVEKPAPGTIHSPWVNSGIMVLDRALLSTLPADRNCDFGREILPAWLAAGTPLWGWQMPETAYLVDMGTPENYGCAQREWPKRMAILKEMSGKVP